MPFALPPVSFFKIGSGAGPISDETIDAIDQMSAKLQPKAKAESERGERVQDFFKKAVSEMVKDGKEAKEIGGQKKIKIKGILSNRAAQLTAAFKKRGRDVPSRQEFRNMLDALYTFRGRMTQSEMVIVRGSDFSALGHIWHGWNGKLNMVAGRHLFPEPVRLRPRPGRTEVGKLPDAIEQLISDPQRGAPSDERAVARAGMAVKARKPRRGDASPPIDVFGPPQDKPKK